ncbi:hypothetical protein [Thorsellia anophelis]|uniref:Uncharacterized protein n=1 Tax=Thorsellia anophelis DSM 18579 TaxID=1123402 RepID=A0A1I0D1Q5_9GAMM|nr:hypothetical protein [Thorsellia anophelis]SET26030.1 hypothetical protein SAMN02583745_01824 [Thorsellia anophelis DSM 18579]
MIAPPIPLKAYCPKCNWVDDTIQRSDLIMTPNGMHCPECQSQISLRPLTLFEQLVDKFKF